MNGQTSAQMRPIDHFRNDLYAEIPEFTRVLPPSITGEAFARVAITAVQRNPKLLECEKQSLFASLMQAAEDGLLPDGREGVLNIYSTKTTDPKTGQEVWIKAAQWLPMVEGVRKLLWNANIILETGVVYARDKWEYRRGDDPKIMHVPMPGPRSNADMVAVYSVARFPDGRVHRDWMWREEVEQVRVSYSRGNGPAWTKDASYPEMAIKTVVHHHSKSLPTSAAVRDLVNRPEFWDTHAEHDAVPRFGGEDPALTSGVQPARTVAGVLDAIGNGATGEQVEQQKRKRRTKAEMDAARAAEANAAAVAVGGNPGGNGQAPPQQAPRAMHTNGPGEGPSSGVVYAPDDPETGEIYDEEDPPGEVALAQQAPTQPDQAPTAAAPPQAARSLNTAEVESQLKRLMQAWGEFTATNAVTKESYFRWLETALRNVQTPEQHKAAIEWWGMTGGMRHQIGITPEETKAFKERVQVFLQPVA